MMPTVHVNMPYAHGCTRVIGDKPLRILKCFLVWYRYFTTTPGSDLAYELACGFCKVL